MLKVAEFLGGFYAVIAVYGGFYAIIAVYTVVSLTGHAIADWLERRYAPDGHRA